MHLIGCFLFEKLGNLLNRLDQIGHHVFLEELHVELVERLHREGHRSGGHFKFIINKKS